MHFKCVNTKAIDRYEIAKNTFSLSPFLFKEMSVVELHKSVPALHHASAGINTKH